MNRYVFGIALLLLAGCATKPEWRLVDGAWIGPQTTYQKGSEPGPVICRHLGGCTVNTWPIFPVPHR